MVNTFKPMAVLFQCMTKFTTNKKKKKKRIRASNAGGTSSIPGWGSKIPHAMWWGKTNKKKGVGG